MRPIEARFASPITLEPNPHAASVAEIAPRLHISDELAHRPEWNIAAAPGTTGEHHVVITPKSADPHSLSTESPGTVEVVIQDFLAQKDGVLTFSHDPDSDEKLRFDLYSLPQSSFPTETVVRNERDTKRPEALPIIRLGMKNSTTGSGIWESAELLSPEETHKIFGSKIVGLVFAMQQKTDKNTQEKKPFTPETVADLIRDIDSAYNEVYENAQEAKISNHEEEPVFTSPKAEGQEWQADFRYLNPNRTQPHEVLKKPDYPNLLTEIVPSYNTTLLKKGENIFVVFHPQLEPADAVPTSLPSHEDIFTHVNAILHQQNPPLAA